MKEIPKKWIIGIDEVGRGPIAGPVYVCAVAMLYKDYKHTTWRGVDDSKKLSINKRVLWYNKAQEMKKREMIRVGVASETASTIDAEGIVWCINHCIKKILVQLDIPSQDALVLLDGGLKAPKEYLYQNTIIQGDHIHKIISLASVVAKVIRDMYMINLASKFPHYGWEKNKGYGTKSHIQRLKKYGVTRYHRKTYLTP